MRPASRPSSTNHTTCADHEHQPRDAAPIAHTSGALRLGGFAGSTKSIGRPSQMQAFGDAEQPQRPKRPGGIWPATSAVAAMIGASTSIASPWLTIVAEPAASTLRTQSARVPYGRAIRSRRRSR